MMTPDEVLNQARSLVSRESFLEMAASRTVVVRCAHGAAVYDRRDHRGLARGAKAVWTWLRGSVVLGAPSPAVNGSTVENIGYTPLRNVDHMVSLPGAAIDDRNPELSAHSGDPQQGVVTLRRSVFRDDRIEGRRSKAWTVLDA